MLDFIAKIIDSLAWPLTVTVLFWLSRSYIQRLLPYVSRLRYKELEVEFERLLERPTPSPTPLPTPEKAVIDSQLATAIELAGTEPSAGMIYAWQTLEKELVAAIASIQPSAVGSRVFGSMTQAIEVLREQNLITNDEADTLQRLRKLRNDVVHITNTQTIVPEDVAVKYAEECHALAARLKSIQAK